MPVSHPLCAYRGKDAPGSERIVGENTIHAELEVTEKKALPRLGGGSVQLAVDVKNQKDEVVMKGLWTVLVASKKE